MICLRFLLLALIFYVQVVNAHQLSKNQVVGRWVMHGDIPMDDPQTSGLAAFEGKLYSVSDASAVKTHQQMLHVIEPGAARLEQGLPINQFSPKVASSCFYNYLSDRPDYEAIVKYPLLDNHWLLVTEDGRRSNGLSRDCQRKYANSGSTKFPSLIVLLKQDSDGLTVTGVRPLKFDPAYEVGNFPNDGIEGLALTKEHKLLLAKERDSRGNARVFEVQLNDSTFDNHKYLPIKDAQLKLPLFEEGRHPINGLDIHYTSPEQGYLIAAARNDNELWIIDLNRKKPAKRIALNFMVPPTLPVCPQAYKMDNTSIEGVAIKDNTLYLINDPWKRHYDKNSQCDSHTRAFKKFSPLLFELHLEPYWFE